MRVVCSDEVACDEDSVESVRSVVERHDWRRILKYVQLACRAQTADNPIRQAVWLACSPSTTIDIAGSILGRVAALARWGLLLQME